MLCRLCQDPAEPALRIYLAVETRRPDGSRTTRGAGRTFLCERCWRALIRGSPRRGGSPPK